MRRLNKKGFTLVELIATIALLALIMGLGGYAITGVINNSKEKNYELLKKEIKNSVELSYQECLDPPSGIICPEKDIVSEYYNVKLIDLVTRGYLKGNAKADDGTFILTNPKDGNNIGDCQIRYKYKNGKVVVEAVNPTGSCPIDY